MQNFFDVRNITVPSNNSDAFSFVTRYLTESEINPMMKYTVDQAQNINLVYDTFCEDEASVSTQLQIPNFKSRTLSPRKPDFAPKFKLTQRIKFLGFWTCKIQFFIERVHGPSVRPAVLSPP